MSQNKSKAHLILLLNAGIKPIELMKIGYSKSAVYYAYRKYQRAKQDYERDIRRLGNA